MRSLLRPFVVFFITRLPAHIFNLFSRRRRSFWLVNTASLELRDMKITFEPSSKRSGLTLELTCYRSSSSPTRAELLDSNKKDLELIKSVKGSEKTLKDSRKFRSLFRVLSRPSKSRKLVQNLMEEPQPSQIDGPECPISELPGIPECAFNELSTNPEPVELYNTSLFQLDSPNPISEPEQRDLSLVQNVYGDKINFCSENLPPYSPESARSDFPYISYGSNLTSNFQGDENKHDQFSLPHFDDSGFSLSRDTSVQSHIGGLKGNQYKIPLSKLHISQEVCSNTVSHGTISNTNSDVSPLSASWESSSEENLCNGKSQLSKWDWSQVLPSPLFPLSQQTLQHDLPGSFDCTCKRDGSSCVKRCIAIDPFKVIRDSHENIELNYAFFLTQGACSGVVPLNGQTALTKSLEEHQNLSSDLIVNHSQYPWNCANADVNFSGNEVLAVRTSSETLTWPFQKKFYISSPKAIVDSESTHISPVICNTITNPHETSKNCSKTNAICDQCGTKFTGTFAKRNKKRHMDAKHNDGRDKKSVYKRTCRICKKVYSRDDGLRKHERKKHSIDNANEIQKRKLGLYFLRR